MCGVSLGDKMRNSCHLNDDIVTSLEKGKESFYTLIIWKGWTLERHTRKSQPWRKGSKDL